MTNDAPSDHMTPLLQGATAAHELFMAYVAAGFTREEAVQIVIALIINSQNQPGPSTDGA